MSGSQEQPITFSDEEAVSLSSGEDNAQEIIDLTTDTNPENDVAALEDWVRGALYMCTQLSIDMDNAGKPPELQQLIAAFKDKLTNALEALKHATAADRPRYSDLVLGPRQALQAWFAQHNRRRDAFRVSIKGLQKMYSVAQWWKARYGAWPEDDWDEDLLMVEFEHQAGLARPQRG